MKRFENAQVGDKVYSRIYGFGEIVDTDFDLYCDVKKDYDILVAFSCTRTQFGFDFNGRKNKKEIEPTLFYVDGDNKYCKTRPKPSLKASQVPIDTKVFIGKDKIPRHFAGVPMCYWAHGLTSFTDQYTDFAYNNHMILAETITINNIVYEKGTQIIEG